MRQVRELEEEIEALASGRGHRRKLKELMNKKELVGDLFNNLRLARQRLVSADISTGGGALRDEASINATLAQLLMVMERLDAKIGKCQSQLACSTMLQPKRKDHRLPQPLCQAAGSVNEIIMFQYHMSVWAPEAEMKFRSAHMHALGSLVREWRVYCMGRQGSAES